MIHCLLLHYEPNSNDAAAYIKMYKKVQTKRKFGIMNFDILIFIVNAVNAFIGVRFMKMFYGKRATKLSLWLSSCVLYVVVASLAYIFFNMAIINIAIGFVAFFVISLNYKSTMLKRLGAVLYAHLIFAFTDILTFALFEISADSFFAPVEGMDVFTVSVSSFLTLLIVLLLQNFRNIKNNIIVKRTYWISTIVIPISSIYLCGLFFQFELSNLVLYSIFVVVFGINLLTFYIYDSLSASYEEKLELISLTAERMQAILDSSPLACSIISEDYEIVESNRQTANLFMISDQQEYIDAPLAFSPEYQPDGTLSGEKYIEIIEQVFESGRIDCEWIHCTSDGQPIPCELTLQLVCISGKNMVIRYIHDLREIKALVSIQGQLEKLAFSDGLTGLYNKRFFVDAAEKEMQLCRASGGSFAIIMIDADFFKKVNDRHGHIVGDEVLKILARRIEHVLRDGSLAARYGGEEFVVMLPDANTESPVEVAWRVHENITSRPFTIDTLSLSVTASLGVAKYSRTDMLISEIIGRADAALYEAKNSGRNTVVSDI